MNKNDKIGVAYDLIRDLVEYTETIKETFNHIYILDNPNLLNETHELARELEDLIEGAYYGK